MKRLIPLAGLLSACATFPPVQRTSSAHTFRPEVFFAGATEGRGLLKVIFSASRSIAVHGSGRVDPDGTLILDQRVAEQGKPVKLRQWRIRETMPGHYAGTLTDATGPVEGMVMGSRLHLSFPIKGGFRVDQWLDLAADGRSARNRLVVRKLGIVVATLDERIVRVEPGS